MEISTTKFALLLIILLISTFGGFAILHPEEVKTLKVIANKIGKTDWGFEKDPCSGQGNWVSPIDDYYGLTISSSVYCVCQVTANVSTCHIDYIYLKGQNLSGVIPPEFSKLKHLTKLDLSGNCFTGSIPSQWATMNLVTLNVMGNKLSGPFPSVLTNISTLKFLSVEANNFSGPIPSEIGRLKNLETLVLSSNGFIGKLPLELFKLPNLGALMISDNGFSGRIPDKFNKLKNMRTLHIQGTFLEGPIPTTISSWNLTNLRISDLKGEKRSSFPDLRNMKFINILILRSCLITGKIPKYFNNMKKLHILDLSFNHLTGEIPASFIQLIELDELYLKGNKLTGLIPKWIPYSAILNIDISENNFTWNDSGPTECNQGAVNLAESYSSSVNNISKVNSCLKQGFPCEDGQYYTSLYINCGGKEVNVVDKKGKYIYESDWEARGASTFYRRQSWALTSTGKFMDDAYIDDSYIKVNNSALIMDNVSDSMQPLYRTARVSPMSLTYYGLCLLNGNYTVNLHFAEIVFTNDMNTFTSLGHRVFDVYIQDHLVLKDFNIVQEAGAAATPIVKTFIANVATNTLKIHFYWAGRGTQGLPVRGTYGPLISAISVSLNSIHPSRNHKRLVIIASTSAAAIVILVFSVIFCIRAKLLKYIRVK